ncbi:MAG: EFR1 family ferrodoxin [Desulfobulbus oligotrophicus]|jgi:ferredoxin|nr:EFR1 family ferrodoxin [Desulfobulbus oligotrophicus]
MNYAHRIVYFSPAGTTRLVAETIQQRLLKQQCQVEMADLSVQGAAAARSLPGLSDRPVCLWIGSPVYCDHAIPLVSRWIDALAPNQTGRAVPFVTWGGVASGLALPEMAAQLVEKQYIPVAAAKVLAVHASMWGAAEPLAQGRPDQADLDQVRTLVDVVVERLAQPKRVVLDLQKLDYLPPTMRAEAQIKSLAAAKASMPPLAADEQLCTSCGICAEVCPTGAIVVDPYPIISEACVVCQQCVQACPEGAFPSNPEAMAARIREMAARSQEEQATVLLY